MSAVAEFWAAQNGVRHITPRGLPRPEGAWIVDHLRALGQGKRVLEFGCGPGRLSCLFSPLLYLGVDINQRSLDEAKVRNSAHVYQLAGDGPLPEADIVLCHTVLLHVPDEELDGVIARMRAPVVVVNEMLGRHWRSDQEPPVFNRDLADYVAAFKARGYALTGISEQIYEHYGQPMGLMEFTAIRNSNQET